MRAGIKLSRALFCVAALATGHSRADGEMNIITNCYRNAIVKISVTSNTPVFDENRNNICKSEGTGFLVNRQTIVTAAHVIRLEKDCGAPIIIAKAQRFRWQVLVDVVKTQDDVALLKIVSDPNGSGMCSLLIASKDVFEIDGFRFGIPDGLADAEPVHLHVGDEKGQFLPFITLSPSPVWPGDSGGPIFHRFQVIGITKARHEKYTNFGLMIRAESLRQLLKSEKIVGDDTSCNPAKFEFSFDTAEIHFPSVGGDRAKVAFDLRQVLARITPPAGVAYDTSALPSANPTVIVRSTVSAFDGELFNGGGSSYSTGSAFSHSTGSAFGRIASSFPSGDRSNLVRNTAEQISELLLDQWWKDYMTALQKTQAATKQ